MLLVSVLFFLAFGYAAVMFKYVLAWRKMPEARLDAQAEAILKVSVVIAARNEAENLTDCLFSIQNGTYPSKLLEIIVVDDFSSDETATKVRQFIKDQPSSIQFFQLADRLTPEYRFKANKKRAIEIAVSQASGEIIVTTDADCIAPKDWIHWITSSFAANPHLSVLVAPVTFYQEENLMQRFQSLDFLGMMGITGAGIQLGWHHMGNGANLAYRKTAFEAVGGFSGNESVASGDDMFLIQKMAAKWSGSVGYLKSAAATVHTYPAAGWREFWQQRLRWGTKNAALPEWRIKLILLLVWAFCCSILLSAVLIFAGLSWKVLVVQLLIKAVADWILLHKMCLYFARKDLLRWFLPSFFLHTAYIILVGTGSIFFRSYKWKGRREVMRYKCSD